MVQRLTYRRRLPCSHLLQLQLTDYRQHKIKSHSSHQDSRRKITLLAYQETWHRSTMWWLWHRSSRSIFRSISVLRIRRFQHFVLETMPVFPRIRKLYSVLTVALVVQIVSRIGLCVHFLLRNRSWLNNWSSKKPLRNRMAIGLDGGVEGRCFRCSGNSGRTTLQVLHIWGISLNVLQTIITGVIEKYHGADNPSKMFTQALQCFQFECPCIYPWFCPFCVASPSFALKRNRLPTKRHLKGMVFPSISSLFNNVGMKRVAQNLGYFTL